MFCIVLLFWMLEIPICSRFLEAFFAELPGSLLTLLARLMEPDPCLMFELIKNKQIVFCPQSVWQKGG